MHRLHRLVLCAGWLLLVGSGSGLPSDLPRAQVVLPSGRTLEAELAVDPEDRARGLMFRSESEFQPDQAMIFLFPNPDFIGFWMKNMNISIDIAWLSSELEVVHLERGVPPCEAEPCPLYRPMQKAQVVIELHRDTIDQEGLAMGDRVEILDEAGAPLLDQLSAAEQTEVGAAGH